MLSRILTVMLAAAGVATAIPALAGDPMDPSPWTGGHPAPAMTLGSCRCGMAMCTSAKASPPSGKGTKPSRDLERGNSGGRG